MYRYNNSSSCIRHVQSRTETNVLHLICAIALHYWLTRTPLALQIFHHLLGGGGCSSTPIYLGSYWSKRKTEKKRSKARQKWLRSYFSQFFASQIMATRAKNGQIFEFFRDSQTSFPKTFIISGTIIARANQKTAFESKLNFPSL